MKNLFLFLYTFVIGIVLSNSCQANASLENYPFQERFISVEGAELFCKLAGDGDPIIVIHGGGGYITHDYLLPYMVRLTEHNRVVFYDQRGMGRSTGELTKKQINMHTYIADLEAIRCFLGVERVIIAGHSWGGFLGMLYAIAHPESIEKLILLGPMPASSEDFELFGNEYTKRLVPYKNELQKIESSDLYLAGDSEAIAKYLRTIFQTYTYNPEDANKLNLYMPQKAILKGFKIIELLNEQVFMRPFNLFNDLCKLQCPTLIVHGDTDPIPFSTAENIQKTIPSAQLIKIEKCGHFPFIEQPEALFKAINDFLQ